MTMPSGLLMWGQAGEYNAADDRRVIQALAGRRVGLIRRPDLRAGSGLQIIVPAWLAIVDCADGTSAVIGDGNEQTFTIPAGPATGSRVDYLWADVDPAAGTWQTSLISQGAMANRVGILLATITVPQGASTAAAMSWSVPPLTFGGAGGILARVVESGSRVSNPYSYTTFATAPDFAQTDPVQVFAGRIYRLMQYTPQAMYSANVGGGAALRVAFSRNGPVQIGTATLAFFTAINQGQPIMTMWAGTLPAGVYSFSVRYWTAQLATYRPDNSGQGIILTLEDCGPTHVSNWT